jgi:5-methylthioadenosine/S-adenosylhomocysteine deaminase
LINAHNHVCNVAAGQKTIWMKDIYPINAMRAMKISITTIVGCADAMRNGTTAIVDMLPNYVRFHADAIIQAFHDCGMRACVGKAAATRSVIDARETRSAADELAAAETYVTRWSGHQLVKPWIGPSGFHACDPETLRALKQLATAHSTRFNIHLSETQFQRDLARQHGYEGQIQWADEIGLLDKDTLVAHAVWINEKEIEILARTGALVAHNATSNQILASGVAPVPQMLRRRITVAKFGWPCQQRRR